MRVGAVSKRFWILSNEPRNPHESGILQLYLITPTLKVVRSNRIGRTKSPLKCIVQGAFDIVYGCAGRGTIQWKRGMNAVTPIQEAYALMQKQPEGNIQIIVELLRKMLPEPKVETRKQAKRTGLSKGLVHFPEDFDEHFDDMNSEISDLFYGGMV